MKNVVAYPQGSRWSRCLSCGFLQYGYPVTWACPRAECGGSFHPDWRPDDEERARVLEEQAR